MMSWTQDCVCDKQRDSPSHLPLRRGEKNGVCDNDRSMEECLYSQYRRTSLKSELSGKTTGRRHLGEWHTLHPVYVTVLVVLLALVVALAVALAVHSGRDGTCAAAVLGCPDDWVGYRNVCYYLSKEERSWEWSRNRCSSLGASLAVIKREWEMDFLLHLKGNIDYWVGLHRQDGRLEWVDGSSFNQTFPVYYQGACVFLTGNTVVSSSCLQHRPYLCRKPKALM